MQVWGAPLTEPAVWLVPAGRCVTQPTWDLLTRRQVSLMISAEMVGMAEDGALLGPAIPRTCLGPSMAVVPAEAPVHRLTRATYRSPQ